MQYDFILVKALNTALMILNGDVWQVQLSGNEMSPSAACQDKA